MIDFIDNTEEASEFVTKKLVEVKHILDEIAEETGTVYVALPESMVAFIGKVGAQWSTWLNDAHKVVADRLNLSLKHSEWMMKRHPDGVKEEPRKQEVKQDDLFYQNKNK